MADAKPTPELPNLARELKRCACFNVRSAARAITGLYDETLEPSGLRMTQVAILAVIQAHGRRTMQLLATDLGLDPSTMTRTLQPLLDARLVRVEPTRDDARARQAVLTAKGNSRLAEAYTLWNAAQNRLRERLGNERFDRLIDDLSTATRLLKK